MSYSLFAPARCALFSALAVILAVLPARIAAQSFPGGNWKDFSDTMVETPDTSMAFDPSDIPEVQPEPDYAGSPAVVQPKLPDTAPPNYEGPIGVTGVIDNVATGCSYSPLSHNALRGPITDIDVPGALGKYGLKMRRYYNSRSSQYWDHAIGLSPGWFHEYSWLLWSAGSKVISAQGNISDFNCGRPVGVSEGWDDGNQAPHRSGGIWRLADGGRVHFSGGYPDYIEDPYGLRTTITRDAQNRVWKVTEPGRRYLQFTYGTTPAYIDPAYGTQLLQKVEAYDGQGHFIERVTYTYTRVDSGGVIPTTGEHVIRRMLTGVTYDDATAASYSYRTDNVPDTPTSPPYTFKFDPLLKGCNDKRYNGPMRQIAYEYQNLGPHGAIRKEFKPNGPLVSKIEPDLPLGVNGQLPNEFTETRGDVPQRKFHYTDFSHTFCPPQGEQCDPCQDYGDNYAWPDRAPQQMLKWYSDFQGNKTYLHYNPNWYIDTVTDANGNATQYERGNPPWQGGIGEIKTITHPAGPGYSASSIHYDYYPETGALDGHYLYHITNENGKITTTQRDANNRIYEIDYPVDGNTPASGEGFAYNGFGQVTAHLMRNGAWESFAYDLRGLLTDKWEPKFGTYPPAGSDPHTHYEYYTSGPWIDRVKTVTGPLPNYQYSAQTSETYEYDRTLSNAACSGRGLVTKITHADGRFQSFKYDQWGNKWREWNELGEGTQYAYDDYKRVMSVTNTATNEVTTYTYVPTNGGSPYSHTTNSPDTITAPTGIMTSNGYDQNRRKTSTAVAGRTTWFHYDLVGNLKYVTDPRGLENDLSHFTTSTDYDTRNRKWHVWDAQGNRTTFTYDDASNVLDIQRPDTTHETKTYDALNRVITDTVPKTNAVSLTTWFIYNPSGTISKVTDSRGTSGRTYPSGDPNFTTSFEYNPSDQKTKMTYPPGGSFQSWAYDDAHNMKSRTTVHGEAEYFAYDNRNRKYGRAWENLSGEWALYLPDAASRLRRAVNGGWQGQTLTTICDVHRDYDHAGRLTLDKQDINGFGVTEVHYQYDKTLRGTDGKPTLMYVNNLGDNYDYDFRYDEMGRFEKIMVHNSSLLFQYHYDNASNETQRNNLFNHINQIYDPDELNRTRKVELRYNNSGFWLESYDYYPIGRLHTVTRGNLRDQFNYYLDGELQSVFYDAMAAEAPDPNEIPPAEDPAKEKTVDDVVALPDGMDPGAPQTNPRTVTYDLDNAGNRTGVTDSLNGSTSYTPNNLNQYTGSAGGAAITNGYEHEINGYNNVGYTYMQDEHLIRVSSGNTTYDLAYDALGRCVKRTVRTQTVGIHQPDSTPRPRPTPHPRPTPPPPSPTPSATPSPTPPGQVEVTKYYVYDGERPILEYDPNRELLGYNLYGKGVDEILVRFDPTGPDPQPFYFQQDHEGSVTHLTYDPPAGQTPILEYYRYDVFGKAAIFGPPPNWTQRPEGSHYSNRFLFTGREWSANFGFYEYRARAYHPGLGRFMSEDPKLFVRRAGLGASLADWTFAAHPDEAEFNLFRYCGNDPIDFTDPMGLNPEFWLIRDYVAPPNSFEARRAPSDLYVKDNHKYTWLGRTNENGFIGNAQGVKQGNYNLVPKGDSWGLGRYPSDQPAITGKQPGLKPGQPNETYKNPALVHEKSHDGRPDSTACVTCDSKTEDRVKQIMRENNNNVPFHIREPARAQSPPDASSVEPRAKQQDGLKRGEFIRQTEYGGSPRQNQ
jgi:RHS repeat-associated protein